MEKRGRKLRREGGREGGEGNNLRILLFTGTYLI